MGNALAPRVEVDKSGKPRLTRTLPDRAALEILTQILARFVAATVAVG